MLKLDPPSTCLEVGKNYTRPFVASQSGRFSTTVCCNTKRGKKLQELAVTLLSSSVQHLRVCGRPASVAAESLKHLRLCRGQAVVAQRRAMASRSSSASSRTSSRSEYRLGVLLWPNSLSSLEALGRRAAFSWACCCASSTCRTTSWTSWLRPWAERAGCGRASAEGRGLLLITSNLMASAWNGVDLTEMRTCVEESGVKPELRTAWLSGDHGGHVTHGDVVEEAEGGGAAA